MTKRSGWFLAGMAAILVTLFWAGKKIPSVPTFETAGVSYPTVLLDAGHGGIDGGAVSRDGAVEKDINLDIALRLRDMLTVTGVPVVMIRETDISVHDPGAVSVREIKRSDLHNRLALTEKHGDCILLSIHQNFFSESKYSGAQFFYSVNHPESKRLAQYFKDTVCRLLQPENSREIKPSGTNIYLMRYAKVPAVLAECGFLSNPTEASLLQSEEYREKVAFTLWCGILNYFRDR